jgi:hypothetical protein
MYKWGARKKIWIFAFLGAVALLLLYPFKTTVVPDWKVRIVDEAGNPMRSFRVREVWQHYTIETYSHEEDLITDGDGYVTFPKRTVRGSLLVRIGWPMVNVINVHASFGPHAYVSILDDQTLPELFSPGQPLTTQLVVKRVPH